MEKTRSLGLRVSPRQIPAIAVLLLLLFPFVVLLFSLDRWQFSFNAEIAQVFGFTAWQAFLSALTSLLLGMLAASGLLYLRGRVRGSWSQLVEAMVLLPNAAPVLLMLLALMNLFAGLKGLSGIVVVHVFLNTGLVAVAFARLVAEKMGGMADLAWIEGASPGLFFRKGVLRYLRGDLFLLFLFVFAMCFSSFAVPLVIGGSRATTVEVLIYEKIRLSAAWSEALGLAALQTVMVFFLSLPMKRPVVTMANRPSALPLMQSPWGIPLALVPTLVLAWGLLQDLPSGLRQVIELAPLREQLPEVLAGSLLTGLGSGFLTLLMLLIIALVRPAGLVRRILLSYVAPSSVLTGFALLLVWRTFGAASLAKMMIGITLMSVPALYRLKWSSLLGSLEGQILVARSLGASGALIFRRILLPQVWSEACFLSGLVAFWAWGDFALSAVIAERSLTTALLIENLMGAYRLEAATALVWILICGGALTFGFFKGLGYVIGTRSEG